MSTMLASSAAAQNGPCETVGLSGKPHGVKECVNGNQQRTITCLPGFTVSGTTSNTVTLAGTAPFAGCTVTDACIAFGYSGRPANVKQCVSLVTKRTITCVDHFIVSGTANDSITLLGPAVFPGCVPESLDYCKRYQASGKPAGVKDCVSGSGTRTITCLPGWFVVGTNQNSITSPDRHRSPVAIRKTRASRTASVAIPITPRRARSQARTHVRSPACRATWSVARRTRRPRSRSKAATPSPVASRST